MQIEIDERTFTGTPVQIVKQMLSMSFAQHETIAGYIEWMQGNAERLGDEPFKVTGSTDEELAASLIEAMIAKGYAKATH